MKNYRILIVDDDSSLTLVLVDWLHFHGHQTFVASTADEIVWLSQWQWSQIDCIICGIYQPGMNGIEFCDLIKIIGGPPVIIMTGSEEAISMPHAYASGASAFLKKPFNLKKLSEIIYKICK